MENKTRKKQVVSIRYKARVRRLMYYVKIKKNKKNKILSKFFVKPFDIMLVLNAFFTFKRGTGDTK